MIESKSRVYIVVDSDNRVTQIEGEYSLGNINDLTKAILVEEGAPCDRLNHAQTAYLKNPLMTTDGIYQYKWDGMKIVERTEEELEADREIRNAPTVDQQIADLKAQLDATDYKVVKCSEAQLAGKELPYDISALHAERQAIRDLINELEAQL